MAARRPTILCPVSGKVAPTGRILPHELSLFECKGGLTASCGLHAIRIFIGKNTPIMDVLMQQLQEFKNGKGK